MDRSPPPLQLPPLPPAGVSPKIADFFYKLRTMIALSPEQRLSVQKCYLHKCATKIHMSYIIEQHTTEYGNFFQEKFET